MPTYTVIETNGDALRVVDFATEAEATASLGGGEALVAGAPPEAPSWRNTINNVWVAKGAPPTEFHAWNRAGRFWSDTRTLDDAKQVRITYIQQKRDEALLEDFTWTTITFRSDFQRLTTAGAAACAASIQGNTGFTVPLLRSNGIPYTASLADTLGIVQAYEAHVAAKYAIARLRTIAILAANSSAEVEAVAW